MAQDSADRTTAARKAAFVRTMLNHPERLKGKTVEEAYAGMRQNVANINKNYSKYEGQRGNTLGPNASASYKGQTSNTAGPKAAYNGQDTATVSGGKKNNKAVGTGLLGGNNAKMSPAPSKAAVERRLNKGKRPRNNGDVVDEKIGKAAKKVMGALTGRRGF